MLSETLGSPTSFSNHVYCWTENFILLTLLNWLDLFVAKNSNLIYFIISNCTKIY